MAKGKKSNKFIEDWSYYLVPGRTKRIKIDDKDDLIDFRCSYCNKQKGEQHHLGCSKELAVCNFHKFVIECNCPFRDINGEIQDI